MRQTTGIQNRAHVGLCGLNSAKRTKSIITLTKQISIDIRTKHMTIRYEIIELNQIRNKSHSHDPQKNIAGVNKEEQRVEGSIRCN